MNKSSIAKNLLMVLALPTWSAAAFNYWDVEADADTSKHLAPTTLSATGLYTDITSAKKRLITNAYHFEVNSPLWSDGAKKMRWVMPKPGTSIKYEEKNDYWGYPDSAVFIKQFAIDTVPGDTTTRLLFETRFLINRKVIPDSATGRKVDRWYGYSYKWDRDQKNARLVVAKGMNDSIKVFPNGISKPGVQKKWRFPSRDQCLLCHVTEVAGDTLQGRAVLGFFTAQLNRPHPDVANINQLEYFFTQNVLTGTKSNWNDTAQTPRWYGIDDSSASPDLRARSYIAANCSGCHGKRGMMLQATFGVDFNYDFYDMKPHMEMRHARLSKFFGLDTVPPAFMPNTAQPPFFYPRTGDGNNPQGLDSIEILPSLVVPGYPEKSAILLRQRSRNTTPGDFNQDPNQMPFLASYEVNVPATALIEKWIKDMPRIAAHNAVGVHTWVVRTKLKGPGVQGRQIVLPMELAGPGLVTVTLTGINGRTVVLARQSRTTYALPANLTQGVYVIKVNSKTFTRYIF